MRTISNGFKNRLQEAGLTYLTRLWSIKLVNGNVLRYCEATRDLYFEDHWYRTDPALEISAIRESIEQGMSDATVTATLNEDDITKAMVRFRDFDDAKINIYIVHSDRLDLGKMNVFNGKILTSNIEGDLKAEFSVRGTFDANNIPLGELFGERCRNRWGDGRCKVNTKKYEIPFEVTHVFSDLRFKIDVRLPQEDQEAEGLEDDKVDQVIYEDGSGNFEVPDCTEFTVQVRAGGGAANATESGADFGIVDQDGEDSTFGDLSASRGLASSVWEGFDGPNYVLADVYSGIDGIGTGGDSNGSPPRGKNVPGSGGAFHSHHILGYLPKWNYGGSGGYALKTYQVGPGKDYQVGDTIPYSVGKGGLCMTKPGFINANGKDGIIKIFIKHEIPEIDKEDGKPEQARYGQIRWTSGRNEGRLHSVADLDNKIVTLMYNNYYPIELGDEGVYLPGCSNYRSMCKEKYNNLINFRGEPDVPNIVAVVPEADTEVPQPEDDVEVVGINMGDALPYG